MRLRKHNDLEDRLREIRALRHCDKKEIAAIARIVEERTVEEGEVLTREGDQAREIFLVRTGHASVYREGQLIGRITDGQLFGEMAVLAAGRRRGTVVADSPMELEVASRMQLVSLLEQAPVLTLKILQAVSARLQASEAERWTQLHKADA
ncbi:MAG: cyclic nucleotide-binding domain-containing protein [Acidimicrobiales bacterium]|nr:cyclic nucleotide-binding domain-containing protein [Acidimicrobiales bacterium]